MTVVNLPSSWTLWFHSPTETSWDISSYQKIATLTSLEDFWDVYSRMTNPIGENGMFFLMRGDINPDMRKTPKTVRSAVNVHFFHLLFFQLHYFYPCYDIL